MRGLMLLFEFIYVYKEFKKCHVFELERNELSQITDM